MNKLYPKDLANAYSVVGQADAMVAVITAWNGGQAPAITTYTVSDISRLKAYCESHDIYFTAQPSPEMGEFDDGGEDYNKPEGCLYYATLCIRAMTADNARRFAERVAQVLGAKSVRQRAETDCDWPKYPDLVRLVLFSLHFENEPNWDALPTGEFTLK
jgi:hypothetical protein